MATKKKSAPKKSTTKTTGSGGSRALHVAALVAAAVADGFFVPLANNHPFATIGIQGEAGVGKSRLSAELAIGLWRTIRSQRPVVIIDTEESARFLRGVLEAAGVPCVVRSTRTLADWCEAVDRAAAGAGDIVITDSGTHLWEDLVDTYLSARDITELAPSDWTALKAVWHREFARRLHRSPVHHIVTFRVGDRYVGVVDAVTGKAESVQLGSKIRGESELAYELTLLIEMRRTDVGRVAQVLKDKADIVDGARILDPSWRSFASSVRATLAQARGPVHVEERSSVSLIGSGTPVVSRKSRNLVDQLRGELDALGLNRQRRAQVLIQAFGTASWPTLERLDPARLEEGMAAIRTIARQSPTAPPTPEAVVASIRQALACDPGDFVERERCLAVARAMGHSLPPPFNGEALGIAAAAKARWDATDFDQRPADTFAGDDLPA